MARLEILKRNLAISSALATRPHTVQELAALSNCCLKTIRRDITAMIAAGVDVKRSGELYSIGETEMNLQCDDCHKTFTSKMGHTVHRARHCKVLKQAQPKAASTPGFVSISTELFYVTKGDVRLRGCEFNGGFLVLNGDTLKSYKSLAEAIADAEAKAFWATPHLYTSPRANGHAS